MRLIFRRIATTTLLLVASVTAAMSIPPAFTYAQTDDPSAIGRGTRPTLEEFYRESVITFFGKDLSSCSGGSGSGPANINVGKDFNLGSEPKERRVKLAQALMRDFGLSAAQAAGIIGNFMQESGGEHLPPDVNEGGHKGPPRFSGGYGWAQWTGSRQDSFIAFAVNNGFMASARVNATDAANYAWLTNELTTGYTSTIVELKKQTTAIDAAVSFHATFEKSADDASQIGERGTSAEQVLAEINGGAASDSDTPAGSVGCGAASANLVGDKAFPLITTKTVIDAQNDNLFRDNTTGKGGHPYTAFDIIAPKDTPVAAFMSGKVTTITQDRCPGRMISIYNQEADVTISYLHLNLDQNTHVKNGATVTAGQQIGIVGDQRAGCTISHLHIDAARGNSRPGCSRNDCPASNASKFMDIGPDLFKTYQALQR